ncbi:sigma-70 family RNA polymerase sigma factor [Desulfitobacterium chlororespirans]|uniref:sigma-70 family RNA polymerase sigma factor n=1 Tax=Desulfitobacterium chlororespirans TaxID=51616 RepID=UPI0009334F8C
MENLDAEQLTSIYESYHKRVYNYISFRINNHYHTEELVSVVFEKIITYYDTYRHGSSPLEAWIITIARNVVMDYFRNIKRGHDSFTPLDAAMKFIFPGQQPDEICVLQEENKQLLKALNSLSPKERNIVAMKYAGGLKNREIAQIMDITESNTGVVIHRALRKMRKYLQEEELSHGFRENVIDGF